MTDINRPSASALGLAALRKVISAELRESDSHLGSIKMLPEDIVLEDVISANIDFSRLLYESIAEEGQPDDEDIAAAFGRYLIYPR